MAFGKKFRDRQEMARAGWGVDEISDVRPCRDCGQPVVWITSPKGKNCTLNAEPPDSTQLHFLVCGGAAPRPASEIPQPSRDIRRAAYQPPPTRESAPAPARTPEAGELTAALGDLTGAVRALLMELQARKKAATPAAPARRFDEDGCPTDR